MYSTLNNLVKIRTKDLSEEITEKCSTVNDVNENGENQYYKIDVRSDTISMPTLEMRNAMFNAVVGDDVYGEDLTVNELEKQSAKMFGKECGLFVPSGTMANLIAVMVHCSRRGAEAIVGDLSHTFLYEQGNAAQLAGVQLSTIKNEPNGTFCLNELRNKIRSHDLHEPITSLVIVENTHNICGGKVVPLEWINKLAIICKEHSIPLHMDGARVFNAIEVLKLSPSIIVKDFSSVCFCLSKGLSAPVGSVLVGSKDFIREARRLRKALGGGMRQAGFLAAAGLVALKEIVPRLGEDHEKVKKIANAIDEIQSSNIQVDLANVQTNILLINIKNKKIKACDLANRLTTVAKGEIEAGVHDENGRGIIVKLSSRDWEFVRIVVYQQITEMDIELTIKKLKFVIQEFDDMLLLK